MTQHSSGLLPALIDYYRRLERDPSQKVAEFGFSVEKIHFVIVLERDGTLYSFEDIRDRGGRGKPAPKSFLVPDGGDRSGIGLKPFFCWDNTGYVLGRDNKDNPGRATEMFDAFRDLHLSFRDELANDDGFAALCQFLESWNPERAETLPHWDEAAGQNVVFKLRAREGYVHQSEAVRKAWSQSLDRQSKEGKRILGESLVSGEIEELARTHPQLSGVSGANTTGAAIVSFNAKAFESYGKSQSYNAPVGTLDAFRYTTALNRLLADDSRKVRIGDATVVFWSGGEEGTDAESIFQACFGENSTMSEEAEHGVTVARVKEFLDAARLGRLSDQIQDPDAPFYILGLSPNKSRLSIRYWLVGTVRQFAEQLARHVADLEMMGARPNDPPLTIRRLLLETVRDPKDIPPNLAGEVVRAVLSDLPYPRALFDAVIRRVRIEAEVNSVKAAILKAYLLRERITTMDIALNRRHPEPAYHCGRMFALLDFAQEVGLESVKAGIVRRNMGAAMASPGLVLGRLFKTALMGHIPKLEGDLQQFAHDELQSICVALGDRIPATLDLVEQGIFALGFYQERSYLNDAKEAVRKRRRFRTNQGEWVASKLERDVANALARRGIRYVYEVRTILKSGQERWPDFFIEGGSPSEDIYLEVLGYKSPEYDKRWESKRLAYEELGITPEGGSQGHLVILDWRDKWGVEPKSKPKRPSDKDVYDLLRPYFPDLPRADDVRDEDGQDSQDAEATNS